jgi:hypothetical protein
MKKTLLLCLALLVAPSAWAAEAKVDPDLDREIRLMLKLTGSEELGVAAMKTMIESFRKSLPTVPEEFWTTFEAEIQPGQLTELVVPIYARHLTIEQIRAANRFYTTEEGKALVAKLPVIMNESMAAGQIWGQAIAQKALERLKAQNYLPKDA